MWKKRGKREAQTRLRKFWIGLIHRFFEPLDEYKYLLMENEIKYDGAATGSVQREVLIKRFLWLIITRID